MLQEILSAATNLPVVIQGAIGSALFALALWIGQRAYAYFAERMTRLSRGRRLNYLANEIVKLHVLTADDDATRGAYLSLLVYRSLKSFFKALVWLTLGLLFNSVVFILGPVGYLGALYYLLEGLNTVRSPAQVVDKHAALKALQDEQEELEKA